MVRRARRRGARPPAPTARDRLLDLLPRGGVVAEVGVWRGAFSQTILKRLEPRELHLVDPWTFVPKYGDSWYGGADAKSQADMDEIFEGVERRFASEIASGTVHLHRRSSLEAAEALESTMFDVVYIDADHTYDAVRADLRAWEPRVDVAGFLTGDDYCDGGWWEGGAKRAVDEFAELNRRSWQLSVVEDQFVFQRGPVLREAD
jgi:hypothetical protein